MKLKILFLFLSFFLIGIRVSAESTAIVSTIIRQVSVAGWTVPSPAVPTLDTKIGYHVSQDVLKSDVNKLFLTGIVESAAADIVPTQNGVDVTFTIQLYPTVQSVSFVGSSIFPESVLRQKIQNPVNQPFSTVWVENSIQQLTDFYHDQGYSLFKVSKVEFTDARGIVFYFSEGVIQAVQFRGLTQFKDSYLTRLLKDKSGKAVNSKDLQRDRERLLKTGYFSDVSAPQLITTKDVDGVTVVYELTEKKSNAFDVGLESDDTIFGLFLQGKLNHVIQKTDTVSGKVLFGFDNSITARLYSLRYAQPWFLNEIPMSFILDGWSEIRRESLAGPVQGPILENQRYGWDTILGFPLIQDVLTMSLKYKSERVTTTPFGVGAFTPYTINSLTWSLNYTLLDNWQNPHTGSYWELNLEKGGNALISMGGISFDRISTNAAHFIPLNDKDTLALHGFAGYFNLLTPNIQIFESEGFFLGGGSSVRGYHDRAFFGNRELLFNAEYRHNFNDIWQGVLFFDVGSVFDTGINTNLSSYEKGYGFGVRYFTPLGPIRLDAAWGGDLIIHINLGQAF